MKPIRHLISIVFLFCGLTAWGGERGYDQNDMVGTYKYEIPEYVLNLHLHTDNTFMVTSTVSPQENRNPKLMEEYAAARSAVSSIISDNCLTSEIDGSEYMVYMLGGGGMLFIIPYASEFKVYRYKDKVMSHTTLPKDSLPEIESLFNFANSQESPLIYDAIESNAKYNPFYFYFGIFNGEGTPILELNSHSMKEFKRTISSRKQRKTYPLTQEQGYCLLSLFLSDNT